MAGEDEEWEPLTEADMKMLQARRERQDQISKRMGDYLLKGYKMLATTCPHCDTILLQTRQGVNYCVSCSELDSDADKDNPALNTTAAASMARELEGKASPGNTSSHLLQNLTQAAGDMSLPSNNPAATSSTSRHLQQMAARAESDQRPNPTRSLDQSFDSLGMTSIDVQSWPANTGELKAKNLSDTARSTTRQKADAALCSGDHLNSNYNSPTVEALVDKIAWATRELRGSHSVEYSTQLATLIKTAAEAVVSVRAARI